MFKRFVHVLLASLVLSSTLCSFTQIKSDYVVEEQIQVVERAMQFDNWGVLKQKDNGYLYVSVSKQFISELLPLIDAPGKIVPPSNYTSKKGVGAHISVMYDTELVHNDIWEIDELGQEFSFCVTELRTVKIKKNNQMKKLWIIAVEAPELEKLRTKYGLSPKLKGHDFHITLGTQVPGKGIQPISVDYIDELFEEHLYEDAELEPEAA